MKMLRCLMPLWYMILPHQDGRSEGDAANGASARSQSQTNAGVQPVVFADNSSAMVNHVSNSGAIVKPTITTYMHTVLMEVLVTIMNCIQSKLGIKKQLMLSPANVKPSSGQLRTQRYLCLLYRTRIKSQQLPPLSMSRTCLDVRGRSAWMTRS